MEFAILTRLVMVRLTEHRPGGDKRVSLLVVECSGCKGQQVQRSRGRAWRLRHSSPVCLEQGEQGGEYMEVRSEMQ